MTDNVNKNRIMYKITVMDTFSSAHRLKNYRGKCENLHGHNWKVEVTLSGRALDKSGILFDFTVLKKILKNIIFRLDHANLNEISYFKKFNPTSENIAKYIFDKLQLQVTRFKLEIAEVAVWESDTSKAVYEK